MAAHVEHRFKRGFLLDEEKLRRLVNIIGQRLNKPEPPISQRFRVFRADSYSYETSDVEDIVNEDHADWRRITRLKIEASRADEFKFELTFSDEGTDLNLSGNDRDQVYLLLGDLREYLKNEVNTCFYVSRDARRIAPIVLLLILTGVLAFFTFWRTIDSPDQAETQRVLDSQQIDQKLDFLIKHQKRPEKEIRFFFPAFAVVLLLLILSITDLMEKIIFFFFPSNLFLFGTQKQRYERRRRILTKVLWGVLIAFIISFSAGLLVWKMTK